MKDVSIDGLKPETLYRFTIVSTLNGKESLQHELEVQMLALSGKTILYSVFTKRDNR